MARQEKYKFNELIRKLKALDFYTGIAQYNAVSRIGSFEGACLYDLAVNAKTAKNNTLATSIQNGDNSDDQQAINAEVPWNMLTVSLK